MQWFAYSIYRQYIQPNLSSLDHGASQWLNDAADGLSRKTTDVGVSMYAASIKKLIRLFLEKQNFKTLTRVLLE